jgi:hypothetical protein
METEKGLVKSAETRLPKFVEDAYESVEKMEQFATILLNSKLVPNHFYEQLPDKKPDFTKGKVPAVVAVLIQGYQLQLPPLTALQHIIPVNGLLSIKGDLAKSMIFNSGKLKPGSWVEEETGTIDAGDYMVKITATRSDNGQTLSRSFSVGQAKRAGLWITEAQVNGQDGWKYKSSAWWKYPTRMCNYRALGFIARDMFPDVMAGIYTTEEAMDIPKDAVEVIETESGAKITIPDKEHSKARSTKMTDRVADKIPDNKFGEVKKDNIQDAEIIPDLIKEVVKEVTAEVNNFISSKESEAEDKSPFIPSKGSVEIFDGKEVKRDGEPESKPEVPGQYTLKGLEAMDSKILLQMVMEDLDMMEGSEIIGGKNTNLKLRKLIFAHQEGKLAEHIAPYLKENAEKEAQQEASAVSKEPTVNTQAGEIPINRDFDKNPQSNLEQVDAFLDKAPLKKEETKVVVGNKYGIIISETTPRDFSIQKALFNKMMGVAPQITTPRFMELHDKLKLPSSYCDKETFLKIATVAEINLLLNAN